MRTLITGTNGKLGGAVQRLLPAAHGVDRKALDVTNGPAVEAMVGSLRPGLIIHCAAWTAVDDAARNPAAAYRVNAIGTKNLALAAERAGAALAYISSNEVFDGAQTVPYFEYDAVRPVNPYGLSKAAGEQAVRDHLHRFYIVRTSWLTAAGGQNFVHRIQQLADERGALQVVTDEIANPTFVEDLAPALCRLIETPCYGVYHLTNQGFVSRFEYARAILERTGRAHVPVTPVTRAQFNRPSTPPPFSALANVAAAELGVQLPPWQESLDRFLRVHATPPSKNS